VSKYGNCREYRNYENGNCKQFRHAALVFTLLVPMQA
jgi:hypothetical protein